MDKELASARTIEIFLPDGNPRSIRVASLLGEAIEATLIPRDKITEAKKGGALANVGVYLLFGISEEHSKPEVYVGEAESCIARLLQHAGSNKDFWTHAIVITSKINFFTKAHVKYLEWLLCDKALSTNRCKLHNSTSPSKPHVGKSTEPGLLRTYEPISLLVSTLGLPIFHDHLGTQDGQSEREAFFCKGRGNIAEGYPTDEGFMVLAGAKASNNLSASGEKNTPKIRQKLINDGLLVDKGDYLELKEDFEFSSPSTAAKIVVGTSINGTTQWKTESGMTVAEYYKK